VTAVETFSASSRIFYREDGMLVFM
jgi:hypothetical protein